MAYLIGNNFRKNLIYLRKIYGKSQTDIALQLDKGHTTVGNWEKGKNPPTINDLLIISQYFDISLEQLLVKDLEFAGYQPQKETIKKWELGEEFEGKFKGDIEGLREYLRQEIEDNKTPLEHQLNALQLSFETHDELLSELRKSRSEMSHQLELLKKTIESKSKKE